MLALAVAMGTVVWAMIGYALLSRTRQFPRVPTSATLMPARKRHKPRAAGAHTACPNLPRPVTSRAIPLPC